MNIFFQTTKDKRFYISLGLTSEIHTQIYLLSFGWEYFDEYGNTEFATMRCYFKHPKYWNVFKTS